MSEEQRMDNPNSHDCGADVAAYALGALDDHELAAFERHLDGCTICRDELTAFASMTDLLAIAAPVVNPPRSLKRKVMTAVAVEAKSRSAVAPRRSWRPQFSLASPRVGLALGAAVVAIVAGALVLPGSGGSATRVINAQVLAHPGHAVIRVTGNRGELVVDHLPALPAGHVYEVWLRRRGLRAPVPTKLFSVAGSGSAHVDVPGSLAGASAMMVTPEPAGGSTTPMGAPIIRASLT